MRKKAKRLKLRFKDQSLLNRWFQILTESAALPLQLGPQEDSDNEDLYMSVCIFFFHDAPFHGSALN